MNGKEEDKMRGKKDWVTESIVWLEVHEQNREETRKKELNKLNRLSLYHHKLYCTTSFFTD